MAGAELIVEISVPVVIIGAGIAGLTCALSLARHGIECVVLERSTRFSEIGAGIQVSPNATGVLEGLGLGPVMTRRCDLATAVTIHAGTTGRTLSKIALNAQDAVSRSPYYICHRADLHQMLLDALADETMAILVSGAYMLTCDEKVDGILVTYEHEGKTCAIRAKVLIGADGVRSIIRTDQFGHPGPINTHMTAWRAQLPWPEYLKYVAPSEDAGEGASRDASVRLWLVPRAHLVAYPMRKHQSVNLVAVTEQHLANKTWSLAGEVETLLQAFDRCADTLRPLIGAASSWTKFALCENAPQYPWARGRMALIGDAAHAMRPFMAQGAAMAIEDAAVLTLFLVRGRERSRPWEEALAAYHAARRQRVAAVWRASRRNGRIYHLRAPWSWVRDRALGLLAQDHLRRRLDWIYKWVPEEALSLHTRIG